MTHKGAATRARPSSDAWPQCETGADQVIATSLAIGSGVCGTIACLASSLVDVGIRHLHWRKVPITRNNRWRIEHAEVDSRGVLFTYLH